MKGDSSHRQAVVFVRINNMDTLDVEDQRSYVVNIGGLADPSDLDEVFDDALTQAQAQARGKGGSR